MSLADADFSCTTPGASRHAARSRRYCSAWDRDKHYPEEAPVHRVMVDGFWMDRTPVTNRRFREFVEATGYVTFAEIAPELKDYPGALPHMLKAGSLVFCFPRSTRRPAQFRELVEF